MSNTNLREWLSYDPATGIFHWLRSPRYRTPAGSPAGSRNRHGYVALTIGKKKFLAHRLAWFFVHGKWPDDEIDHANGDRADNRIANLREATSSQNKQNTRTRCDNASGIKGVDWYVQTERWRASITVNGRRMHLGYFSSKEEAASAYQSAADRYFGNFARAA